MDFYSENVFLDDALLHPVPLSGQTEAPGGDPQEPT